MGHIYYGGDRLKKVKNKPITAPEDHSKCGCYFESSVDVFY